MTRKEWMEQAERQEAKAQTYYENGDELLGELWQTKARASRGCAMYALDAECQSDPESGADDD